ncbi:putative DNA-binding domain-containing protein [Dongia sp.]|uniref:HvfC/BufC family peptide modification chaperone n=1 Tax=Dongia sp. TaxID=1977262 RepID=UPI0035AF8E13
MTSLSALQADFQAYLLHRAEGIVRHVQSNGRLCAADLLEVYRRGYGLRLVEALGNDFPGLKAMSGEEAFERLARAYVAAYPSRHPSLRWLGRALPDYLAAMDPLAAGMARFDWAVALAFDARDEEPAGLADLFALPPDMWETFTIVFADGVSVFTADASMGDLRHAFLRDSDDRPAAAGYETSWIVWRHGEEVQYRRQEQDEAAAFGLMRDGGPFGAMCRLLAERGQENAAPRSAEIIKDWLERGLVAAVVHDAPVSF